jgi:CBS domain-containing protein
MHAPVHSLSPSDRLADAARLFEQRGISSAPVVDDGKIVGVISRTDLLREGRLEASGPTRSLVLPDRSIAEVMSVGAVTVKPDARVARAAAWLVHGRIHRVFVEQGDALLGVLSTKDILRALADEHVRTPIRELMTRDVLTVTAESPLGEALEKIAHAGISGLVVTEQSWPIGVLTQVEALAARNLPKDTPVDRAMSPAMLCLDADTPVERAAAQAAATRARRVIAVKARNVEGILTGIDFARAAMD